MSKRSTTGQPRTGSSKTSPTQPETKGGLQPRLLREYKTRHEREAVVQRWVILGTGAAIAIAVVIMIIAIIGDQLIRPGQTVAQVNGETITVAEFSTRARLERALLSEEINKGIALLASFGLPSDQIAQQISSQPPYNTYLSELNVPDQLGNRVLNDMIEDELVRQKAAELGISVTDEEVQNEINEFFNYDPNLGVVDPTATPSPTLSPTPYVSPTPSPVPTATYTPSPSPTPEATLTPTLTPVPSVTPSATPNAEERAETFGTTRNDFYSRVRSSANVSDEVINEYFRMRALRLKVRDAVLTDANVDTDTFVNARHILVATQEEAQRAIDAINAGESFAAVAAAVSTDGSAASGGELGWSQPSRYVEEFADAVTDAPVGEIVGPVQTQFGFHVIQVTGREERPITEAEREIKLNDEFNTYVEGLRDDEANQVEIFDIWADNVPEEPIFVPRGL